MSSRATMNNQVDIKIVLLGNENVGKTTLLERFIHERFLERPYQSTIGAAFAAKDLTSNGKKYIVGVWDTAGSERYRAMLKMFYRNAKAAIVCYDICDETSWGQLRSWISELRNHEEDCVIYLCGTKKDLVDDCLKEREISYETASRYARSIQVKQMETSSKSGENVAELFQMIVDDYSVHHSPQNHSCKGSILLGRHENGTNCCKML